MRLHRFYTKETIDPKLGVTIHDEALIHQWKKVFRLTSGDQVIVFDGSGTDYIAEISFEGKDSAALSIVEAKKNNVGINSDITLYAAIVKKDNFEWIVEKATELGVSKIVPVISERSEKKNLNIERLRRILIESSEQSWRGNVPVLAEIISLEDVITEIKSISQSIIAWDPTGDECSESEMKQRPISIFVGPEGGWSERELAAFKDSKIKVRSIGKQILRAETAVIAILSKITL